MNNSFLKKVLLCLIILFSILVNAQNKAIDSLQKALLIQKEDTNKVHTLIRLSKAISAEDPSQEIIYATQALELSKKINYHAGITASTINIATGYLYLGKYDMALDNYYKALSLCKKGGEKRKIAMIYCDIGVICDYQGKYSEAVKSYSAALDIDKKSGDKAGMSVDYCNIGVIYLEQGNYPLALQNQFMSLKISEGINDKEGIARALGNIGNVYNLLAKKNEALKYFQQALKINEILGVKRNIASSLESIGGIYADQGKFDDALRNYTTSLNLCKETKDELGIANSYCDIAGLYFSKGNYSAAVKTGTIAIKMLEELGNLSRLAILYNNMGLASAKIRNFLKAKEYLIKGLAISKEIGSLDDIKESYGGFAFLDSAQGNFKEGYIHLQNYIVYKDSVLNDEHSKKMLQTQMQYEFDKKQSQTKSEQEKKDALALKEFQKEKLLNYISFGGIGLIILLFYFIYRNYHVRQELRLLEIRNRIARDLHDDIGSTLSSISIFSEIANQKKVNPKQREHFLKTISTSSRNIIETMNDIVWTVNPMNDKFENILLRMRSFVSELTEGNNVKLTVNEDENCKTISLGMNERKNFYLIFKEAVNNAIKYSGATEIEVNVKVSEKDLLLTVKDNGVGFDPVKLPETIQHQGGNGLLNMKVRADEIKAKLTINSILEKGTTIELKMKI